MVSRSALSDREDIAPSIATENLPWQICDDSGETTTMTGEVESRTFRKKRNRTYTQITSAMPLSDSDSSAKIAQSVDRNLSQ